MGINGEGGAARGWRRNGEEKEEIEREVVDVRHGRVSARRDPVLQPRISSRLRGDPTRLRRGVPAAGACGEAGTGRWRNIGAGA